MLAFRPDMPAKRTRRTISQRSVRARERRLTICREYHARTVTGSTDYAAYNYLGRLYNIAASTARSIHRQFCIRNGTLDDVGAVSLVPARAGTALQDRTGLFFPITPLYVKVTMHRADVWAWCERCYMPILSVQPRDRPAVAPVFGLEHYGFAWRDMPLHARCPVAEPLPDEYRAYLLEDSGGD